MISENVKAPELGLKDQDGNMVNLTDYIGQKIVLYFYPKDNTPGCTKEACSFRDYYIKIIEKGAVIFGVSADSGNSHQNFIAKHNLPFPLLVDPDNDLARRYGIFGEKKMYGKSYLGVFRTTFIINEEGYVEKIFPSVKPADHGKEVYEYLNS